MAPADAEAIFHAALAIEDEAKRAVFLDRACQGDPLLHRQVEVLLRAEAGADEFFEPGTLSLSQWVGHPTPSCVPPLKAQFDLTNTVFGNFRLLEELGRGGFGVVYRAQQTAPVRREVAIKIIKLGMDTREVVQRFEAERQVLALMAH